MKNSPPKLFIGATTVAIISFVLSASILSDLLTVYSWFVGVAVALPLFLWGFVQSRKLNNPHFQILNLLAISILLLLGLGITWLISVLPGA